MKKVLLRTLGCISLFAILLSSVTINAANPVFIGIGDAVLNGKAVSDATFRKPAVTAEKINSGFDRKAVTVADISGSLFKSPAIETPVNLTGSLSDNFGSTGVESTGLTLFNTISSTTCPTGIATVTYSGAIEEFQVPAGVTQVTIMAIGANGGDKISNPISNGGTGAILKGAFSVSPLQKLQVLVGGKGIDELVLSTTYTAGGGGGSYVFSANTYEIGRAHV